MASQYGDEVVVTARYLPFELYDLGSYAPGSGMANPPAIYAEITVDNSSFPVDQPPVDGSYQPPPNVLMEDNDPLTPEALRFKLRLADVHQRLGNAQASKEFLGKLGIKTDIGELYANNLNLDFLITKNVQYLKGFGGGVSNKADGSGFRSSMARETLSGYDKHEVKGLNYLAIHELIHTTPSATKAYDAAFKAFIARGGNEQDFGFSPELASVENAINSLTRDVLIELGLSFLDNPTHGY